MTSRSAAGWSSGRSTSFGRLDVVVSSAAKGTPNHTIMNSDLADWEQSWLVNVLGPLELCRSAVPHLQATGGGAIVVVSTLAVRAINAGQGAYAATKGALDDRGADVGARGRASTTSG